MIKSMTGFSALTREDDLVAISVTLRAVNHRYLDVQVRVPQALQDQETRIRALLQQAIARGRVEVGISLQFRLPPLAKSAQLNVKAGGTFDNPQLTGEAKVAGVNAGGHKLPELVAQFALNDAFVAAL